MVKCPYCEYQTNISAGFASHLCNHHGDALQAERPDRKSDMSNLKLHSRKHTGAMLQCMYCRYKTTRSNTLKTHLRIHTGDKLQCPHCHYKTAFSSDLKQHLRKHTGDMLQCPHCDYETSHSGSLNVHLRKHTGDMLQCPHCEYKTTRSGALKKHLRIHGSRTVRPKTGKDEIEKTYLDLGYPNLPKLN